MAIAQSDIGIELWSSATGAALSFSKLIDVTSIPATGSAQGKLEATVLSSTKKQYIADRADLPDLEFTYNYTASNFSTVQAIADTLAYFMIVYGDGSGAVIYGEGNSWVDAVSRGAVVEAKLNIVPESIDFKTSAEVTALKAGS
jgi:hypothetical protein